ncbi:AfsR/SARP family transcriptional regulator [Actinomadura madurae]|uniref:AfsR/SARP family transcriptional regulator n=1 Tax=Actinomadura madurae TaxID=1993 RepID=UPI0020D24905|nr:AfsR/SARP family transcriptional regulator [Actinomadura madurae]MCQ0009961.1 winged helix-turn-helix domain-containing protein [Actinomadura madurae]
MRIGILGPLDVRADDGAPVAVGGARLRVLLTLLALDPGTAIPADRIIDALWEDAVPRGAPNALQSLVSRLRAAIGRDVIESGPGAYRLVLPPGSVDAHDFEARVRAARAAAEPGERSAGLRDALALWRGPALADAAGLRFADAPAARLDALRRTALEDRLDADLALGRHAELIPELQALAAADPLREPVAALLMRALYASGQQAEALARYQDARRALGEELGVDPSPELEAVHLSVLRQDPSLLPDGAPPPKTSRGNLKARLTSFIGRDADLGRVGALLARSRLVTLTGPGGAGKSRLSVESAERLAGRMPDGAWLVELAPVSDPAEVPAAVLTALGLREPAPITAVPPAPAPDPADRLVTALSGPGGCCCSWTTASTCLTRRPGSPRRSWRTARASGSSRRAGNRSASPGRRSAPSSRWSRRPRTRARRRRCPPRPSGCSPTGRRPCRPGSRSPPPTPGGSSGSAAPSTGCRSRSSWPPPGSAR